MLLQDEMRQTPMHKAAQSGVVEIAKILLEAADEGSQEENVADKVT